MVEHHKSMSPQPRSQITTTIVTLYYIMFLTLPQQERNATEMDVASEKVVLVTTQLDTFTMFESNEMGADAPSTGIVALLETAALVAKNMPDIGGR